ncbi:YwpF-like family protein [Bacillus pinisoli]|uniref:YwpF-like family protein n=1 Tax=Bacillus pinisoli TaxID=2901866 RepID=UPI001FF2757D|nr:YwpF-like family protein [Bacillus pinisoli]
MKTFKLVSLKISHPQEQVKSQQIHLIDGLVINKEDEERKWLLEAYVGKECEELFTKLKEDEQEVKVEATISRKDNDPAAFITTIQSVAVMEENMSVLFNGVLVGKADMSEAILSELIEEGFQGNVLLQEFKKRVYEKKNTGVKVK